MYFIALKKFIYKIYTKRSIESIAWHDTHTPSQYTADSHIEKSMKSYNLLIGQSVCELCGCVAEKSREQKV